MSSLGYRETQQLIIWTTAFNERDIAKITVIGHSVGETWVLRALPQGQQDRGSPGMGQVETINAPGRPDLALEIASEWIKSYCRWNSLEIVEFKSHPSGPFKISADFSLAHRAS